MFVFQVSNQPPSKHLIMSLWLNTIAVIAESCERILCLRSESPNGTTLFTAEADLKSLKNVDFSWMPFAEFSISKFKLALQWIRFRKFKYSSIASGRHHRNCGIWGRHTSFRNTHERESHVFSGHKTGIDVIRIPVAQREHSRIVCSCVLQNLIQHLLLNPPNRTFLHSGVLPLIRKPFVGALGRALKMSPALAIVPVNLLHCHIF